MERSDGGNAKKSVRTREDLQRAVRAVAATFKSDAVVIVGSQSVLVGWPQAPSLMRTSGEIDAYPTNARRWERENHPFEASELVNALFGAGSDFEEAHGFFIDGVDDETAKLPPGWKSRAVFLDIEHDGRTLTAIAPCTEDMVVAKLQRLVEKDRSYIAAHHAARPLDTASVLNRLRSCSPMHQVFDAAEAFLKSLPEPGLTREAPTALFLPPPHPEGTHIATWSQPLKSWIVREIEVETGLATKIGNPLGPAVLAVNNSRFMIGGVKMGEEEWRDHPDVIAANRTPEIPGPADG